MKSGVEIVFSFIDIVILIGEGVDRGGSLLCGRAIDAVGVMSGSPNLAGAALIVEVVGFPMTLLITPSADLSSTAADVFGGEWFDERAFRSFRESRRGGEREREDWSR